MSRLSGPERGEQNLAKVRSYLAGLQAAGQSLPLEDGRPNISAIAEAAGVLRNVFYTNSGVRKLLAEFVGGSGSRSQMDPRPSHAPSSRWRRKAGGSSNSNSNWRT